MAVVLPLFALVACEKDSVEDAAAASGRYYVKYVISSDTMNDATIMYTTERGEQTANVTSKKDYLDEAFGPVSKGFEAYAFVKTKSSYPVVEVKIYVSLAGEPFVLKAHSSAEQMANASYVID